MMLYFRHTYRSHHDYIRLRRLSLCDGHVNCCIPRTTRVTAPIIEYECKSVSKDVSCRGIKASVAHGTCDQQQKRTIAPELTINLSSFHYYLLFNWSRFHYKYKRLWDIKESCWYYFRLTRSSVH